MLGYGVDEWLSTPNLWLTIVHPEDRDRVMSAATECYSTGKSSLLEFRWITKDGKTVGRDPGRPSLRMRKTCPQVCGASPSISPIERTWRNNFARRRRWRLSDSLPAESRTISTIFSQSLSVSSDLALEQFRPEDPLRQDLEEINKAGQRASSMTRQLLAFSRKQVLQLRVCDLNRIVSEMDKMLQRLIGENIRLETSLCPGLRSIRPTRVNSSR